MNDLRKAAEAALEALEWCEPQCKKNPEGFEKWANVMPVLREALAQPEQEPVAWMSTDKYWMWSNKDKMPDRWIGNVIPLYTAPPQRKPLMDEEIELAYREIWRDLSDGFSHTSVEWIEAGIRYAEKAHGIGGDV